MQGMYYIENTKTQRRYYGSSFNIEKKKTNSTSTRFKKRKTS